MQLEDNNLKRTVLTLSNKLQRIHTEAEWRNDAIFQDEYETYWVEFTALFNNKRKREEHFPT
ncbi:hypothetical protein RhiirA4_450412 [Rhizophagus irregularis]|uniref:Uncharacterized protein n=1 Tax=Rhizophagus irregularis TaxID=588596 RepID=A0A2I1FT78_9GLOM|nr:hypothetical protein RhiirA4_450412 [Rhizophagus irregularis]